MNFRRSRRVALLTFLASAVAPSAYVTAHTVLPPRKRGGFVLEANEIFFEIVTASDKVLVYVEDDGRPLPTSTIQGSIVMSSQGRTLRYPLMPAGANVLQATMPKPAVGTALVFEVLLSANDRVAFTFVVR